MPVQKNKYRYWPKKWRKNRYRYLVPLQTSRRFTAILLTTGTGNGAWVICINYRYFTLRGGTDFAWNRLRTILTLSPVWLRQNSTGTGTNFFETQNFWDLQILGQTKFMFCKVTVHFFNLEIINTTVTLYQCLCLSFFDNPCTGNDFFLLPRPFLEPDPHDVT